MDKPHRRQSQRLCRRKHGFCSKLRQPRLFKGPEFNEKFGVVCSTSRQSKKTTSMKPALRLGPLAGYPLPVRFGSVGDFGAASEVRLVPVS